MSEFGKTLRAAREAKGLTTGQIAEQTHMMVQTVEGLENEDFSKIVAPIYGRGFVKLYCEAVGLDPKPLVDTFTEIYADRHAAPPAAKVAEPPSAAPAREVPPAPPKRPEPASEPKPDEPPPKFPELDFGAAPAAKQSLSRYAGKMPSAGGPSLSLPFVNWRLVALVVGAFAALLCLGLVIRAAYHATMSVPDESAQEEQEVETPDSPAPPEPDKKSGQAAKPGQAADAKAEGRRPLPLKPFYIDSDHSTETQKERKKQ